MNARAVLAGLFACALAALCFGVRAPARAQTAPEEPPIVVELYTSQGCFSCPRANRLLGEFSRDPSVLALTFPVGYWDYLGWSDTYARPEFVNRQRDFARALRFRGPYTPQLILGGVRQVSAGDWDEARAALDEVRALPPAPGAPRIEIERGRNGLSRVTIGTGVRQGLSPDIWFITYDPGPLTVLVTAGDNANRRVTHYNLVQRITRVASWTGTSLLLDRVRCFPECAVLVQEPRGGRIIAAAFTHNNAQP